MPGTQSKLEKAAIIARGTILPQNVYNDASPTNEYTATHTRAMADATTPVPGKGTGQFLDIDNYNAGGDLDINGTASNAGSGRKAAITLNKSTWGYGPDSFYQHPDTSLNNGAVTI